MIVRLPHERGDLDTMRSIRA